MAQGKIWTGPFLGPFFGPLFGPFFWTFFWTIFLAQGKIWTGPFSGPFFGPSFGPFFGPLFGPFFGPFFGLFFGPFFWDHFIGGKHTISTQGRVRCSLLVLREEWKAECHYSGRGERRTIARQGGVGGGCKSKHYLLMELLLNHKFIFIGFFLMTF